MYDVGKCLLSDKLLLARMSQQELADRINVTKQQIHSYVVGNRLMTLPIAKNIASVLHCEINDLYEWLPVEERRKRR